MPAHKIIWLDWSGVRRRLICERHANGHTIYSRQSLIWVA